PADLALVEHRRARLEMDGHALAPGDEAGDRVARDRVAALGEADEQVADALDPDAAGPLQPLRRRDGRKRALDIVDDAQAHDHGLRVDRPVADRRVEVVERVVVVAARDLDDLVRPDGRDRGPRQAAQLALERLTPVDDVLVGILALEPLPDLLAGVAGLDDLHPVARRA